jgi:hypothetical protein
MAWQAFIASKEKDNNGILKLIVIYFNDKEKHAEEVVVDFPNADAMKARIVSRLDYLTAMDTIEDEFVLNELIQPTVKG